MEKRKRAERELWRLEIAGQPYEIQVAYKKMRTIRLRVLAGGEIRLSAPFGVEETTLKRFLWERACWLAEQTERMKRRKAPAGCRPLTAEERKKALAFLQPMVDRLYPVVGAYGVAPPHVTVRAMRTRYGSCSVNRGRITLNAMLADVPESAAEYVVLHELAHFLYPNHSRAFYDFIEGHMPDWRERERRLRMSL